MLLVTGYSGFVGSHLVRGLIQAGYQVKCLARKAPEENVDSSARIIHVQGDVTRRETLAEAVDGVHTIIHLVGIIKEKGLETFERVHVEGTANLISAANSAGARRFIYISAIGARHDGVSRYQTSKWYAEELVRSSGLEWMVLRPSVMIGQGGEFVRILVDLVSKPPVVPIIGSGQYMLQPLYVGDLVRAIIKSLENDAYWGTVHELGGPKAMTFNGMIEVVKKMLRVNKPVIHIPIPLVSLFVKLASGLITRLPITYDQLRMLLENNVTDRNALIEVFEIEPTSFSDALAISLRGGQEKGLP